MTDLGRPTGVHYYPVVSARQPSPGYRTCGSDRLALYVHIPFCEKRCYFCEFAVVSGKSINDRLVDDYLHALREEIRAFLRTAESPPPIELVQFGGGTPTSLSATALADLLEFIFDHFDCSGLKEVIVEGFPASITDDRIAVLERVPKLKLNIGVQSFHAECLESVGRGHGLQAKDAIARAVASRISSVGADIIVGLPNSSPAIVRADLEQASQLGIEHFALYPLWVYDHTALESRIRSRKIVVPGRAAVGEQLFAGAEALHSLGYSRYTAFHYALNEASRHQYGLWQMQARDWVGFGMSAMSYLRGETFFNDRSIRPYLRAISSGDFATSESCRLSEAEHMRFALLYGLRMETYPTSLFSDRFGVSVDDVFGAKLDKLEEWGLLTRTDDAISLTLSGALALSGVEDYLSSAAESPVPSDQPVLVEA